MTKTKEKKSNKIIKLVISTIFLLISLFLVYSIHKLDIIPAKFMIIGIIGLLILNITADALLFTKKKWPKIISAIIYILILIVSILGINFSKTIDNFLNKAFNNEIKTMSLKFYIMSQNDYKETDLNNKDLYYYNNSVYINDAIEKVNQKFTLNIVNIEDINELFNQDLFLIDDATFDVLSEELELDVSKYRVIYTIDLTYNIKKEESKEKESAKKEKHYYNIYVGAYDFHGNQMDLNKIVTVNTETNRILITNIHRFAYLDVPGYTQKNRLNAMSIYGVNNNIAALENLLGIKFDYYLIAEPTGLVTLVDDIGGIEYCSDKTFTTDHAQVIGTYDDSKGKKVHIKKGCQHLNGIETLTVARERMAFKMGAKERDNNTTEIMIDIFDQLKKPSNIAKYATILDDLSGMYYTSIPREVITKTAKNMINKGWQIETNTIEGKGGTDKIFFSNHKGSVVYLNPESVEKAIKKIKSLDK